TQLYHQSPEPVVPPSYDEYRAKSHLSRGVSRLFFNRSPLLATTHYHQIEAQAFLT
ncbi:hypothetical protein PanWU01x14_320170, partial [Parasponia andersonii]